MWKKKTGAIALLGIAMAVTTCTVVQGNAQNGKAPYPLMAPAEQYQMPREAEIEMARSAAPESISHNAEIHVLGGAGYEVAAKGTNGFVCLVQRSFAAGIEDPQFWNPKVRSPICLNAEAARSFLPHIMKKAEWALAGFSKELILKRIKAARESKEFPAFAPGAMCYMMSKQGFLSDRDGAWHPHMMFFTSAVAPATWGANLSGSPLLAMTDYSEGFSIFLLPVGNWSDGTSAPLPK